MKQRVSAPARREASPTDAQLVCALQRRVRRGTPPDREAEALFQELYSRHVRWCYAFVASKVHPSDVEDVLSEVWIGVWNALSSGRQVSNFAGLLHSIVRNKIADACEARYGLRKLNQGLGTKAQRPDELRRIELVPLEDDWPEEETDPEAELLREEEIGRLKELVAGLHRPWRLALQCRLSLQMSVQATAERLGVSEGAVKKYVARGLKALRRAAETGEHEYGQEDEEEGGE